VSRYLVVAHQTAGSPEVVERVREIAGTDPAAEFVLLVPATPVSHLLLWEEGETLKIARRRAETAKARLQAVTTQAVAARVGDGSPLQAIADELTQHPGYDAILISTLPPGISRWLRMDLPRRVARQFSIKVIHVVAQPRVSDAGRTASET
jgi:hypothetical protein